MLTIGKTGFAPNKARILFGPGGGRQRIPVSLAKMLAERCPKSTISAVADGFRRSGGAPGTVSLCRGDAAAWENASTSV